jgi:mevalonate kinase
MTKDTYYSHGKILLTGEYLVLNGAKALVLPLNRGQSLEVTTKHLSEKNTINWKALQFNNLWFEAVFNRSDLSLVKTNNKNIADKLAGILMALSQFCPDIINHKGLLNFETNLNFDRNWGFGTSSTLISNLARWAGIEPIALHSIISNGSGYDVAATTAETPFIYSTHAHVNKVLPLDFRPPYSSNLFFVYLGNKQDSAIEVDKYLKDFHPDNGLVKKISNLTFEISNCMNYDDFERFITMHEEILSEFLKRNTIKNDKFTDFDGAVKSLGAWGGDFVLMATSRGTDYFVNYIKSKGLNIFFPYNNLVHFGQVTSKILI